MKQDAPFLGLPPVGGQMRLTDALDLLRQSSLPAIPILDEHTGQTVAVLARPFSPAVVAPPRLGGMATPLGVYLTDGVSSGGAGFWGLLLAGMALCGMALSAEVLTQGGLRLLAQAAGRNPSAWIGVHAPAMRIWLSEWAAWLPALLVFLGLRLVPMSGVHAAEHQVVHCIERRLPLTQEDVRAMPRVHPRCGTNLLVGFFLFLLVFSGVFCLAQEGGASPMDGATLAALLAAPPALLLWRRLGALVQQWLATRPATDRQIAGAIRAAEQLLARRQMARCPAGRAAAACRRLWMMGLAQMLLGYGALFVLVLLVARAWPWFGHLLETVL